MSSGVHEHLSVPLEGKLGDPAILPRLFAWLARGEWSGTIHVTSGDVERRVYFVEGRVSSAASNDPADSLATHLRGLGLVRPEALDMALAALGPGDKTAALARQLLRMGSVHERDLAAAERRRTIAIAEATLGLRTGQYRAEAGAAATDAMPQGVEVARVVATGVLKSWDESWALEVLGGPEAILDVVPERLAEYEATGAEEAYDLTLLRVDGRSPLRQVVAASPLPEAAALKFLAACRLLGCVEVVVASLPKPVPAPRPAQPVEERDDERTAASSAPAEQEPPARERRPRERAADDVAEPDVATRPPRRPPVATGSGGADTAPGHAAGKPRRILVALLVVVLAGALAYAAYLGWHALGASESGASTGAAP